MKLKIVTVTFGILITAALAQSANADDVATRYGFLNGLDHRSIYGQGYFPEPFLVDDSDLEPNEARVDWTHLEGNAKRSDEIKTEWEHAFGLLTIEAELSYERDNDAGTISQGTGNFELSGRYPLYQFVSASGLVDSTFGAALELAAPTHSSVSRNGEIVPKVFNDLKLGNLTLQSIAGYSAVLGPNDGNVRNFEYGCVFGYSIQHQQLPLPGVQEIIPMFELTGETELNKANAGHTSLLGDAGFRVFCKSIGQVQPRLGVGIIFPLNNAARDETHWGIVTSLVFQY